MIYTEPQQARGRSFHGLLAYLLHDTDHAESSERVLFGLPVNLASPSMDSAADELRDLGWRLISNRRSGQRPDKLAFHFVLSWHRDDKPTNSHMIETAHSALAALGLADHLAVVVGHDDTGTLHAHVVVNVLHPETGRAAKLGWRHRTMSRWAGRYEQEQGIIRCPKRRIPKAANENRRRLTRAEWQMREGPKQKAGYAPALRP